MNFTGKKIFTSEELKDLEKKVEDAIVEKLKAEVRYLIDKYLNQEITSLPDITNGNKGIVITVSSWNKCYEDYPDVQRMLSELDVQPFSLKTVYGGILVSYVPGDVPALKPTPEQEPVSMPVLVQAKASVPTLPVNMRKYGCTAPCCNDDK